MRNQKISCPIQLVEKSRPLRRRGITLIELLIVVTILVILVGFSASAIRPLTTGRDKREAAGLVNAYFAAAQNRAIELGRPVGVWLERSPNDSDMAVELFMAEIPSPYTGDNLDSCAQIDPNDIDPNDGSVTDVTLLSVLISDDPNIVPKIAENDFIRFNYRGPLHQIQDIDPNTSEVEFFPPKRIATNTDTTNTYKIQIPFQVFRYGRPVRSAYNTLQLPNAVALDISMSGEGADGLFGNKTRVAIMFSPAGGIEYIINGYWGEAPYRATSVVHLLLGHSDQSGIKNLNDQNNRWVSIGHLTGRVTTSEVYYDPNKEEEEEDLQLSDMISKARKNAIQRQTTGN